MFRRRPLDVGKWSPDLLAEKLIFVVVNRSPRLQEGSCLIEFHDRRRRETTFAEPLGTVPFSQRRRSAGPLSHPDVIVRIDGQTANVAGPQL
jgi:hypothetical protein